MAGAGGRGAAAGGPGEGRGGGAGGCSSAARAASGAMTKTSWHRLHRIRAPLGPIFSPGTRNLVWHVVQVTIMGPLGMHRWRRRAYTGMSLTTKRGRLNNAALTSASSFGGFTHVR